MRQARQRAMLVAVGLLVAIPAVAPVGVQWAFGGGGSGWTGGDERSLGQTVSGYFLAQRDGDCGRLLELVAQETWSDGGQRTRSEFLEQCAPALEGYEPEVEEIDVEIQAGDPDRAQVGSFVAPTRSIDGIGSADEPAAHPPIGHLVREDGEWRVVAGVGPLRLGRSVEQTVLGYLDAYNDGDCDRVVDHLSEAAWSAGGARNRAQFVERCDAAAQVRRDRPWQSTAFVVTDEVRLDGDDRARAEVRVGGDSAILYSPGQGQVALVREGLEWKLDGTLTGGGEAEEDEEVDRGRPLPGVELLDLQAQLLGEVAQADGSCFISFDHPATDPSTEEGDDRGDEAAVAATGVRREFFGPCEAEPHVTLYAYGDAAAAEDAADRQATAILADEVSGGGEPGQRVAVPGMPDATGLRTFCNARGCGAATALGVRDGILVRVDVRSRDHLEQVGPILAAQLERL